MTEKAALALCGTEDCCYVGIVYKTGNGLQAQGEKKEK